MARTRACSASLRSQSPRASASASAKASSSASSMSSGGVSVSTSPAVPPVSTIQPRSRSRARHRERPGGAALERHADHQPAPAHLANAQPRQSLRGAAPSSARPPPARARAAPRLEASSVASAAAHARGDAEVRRRVDRRRRRAPPTPPWRRALPTQALMGMPPPRPLPRQRTSGTTPSSTLASHAPLRPSPVQISSQTSSAPAASHAARSAAQEPVRRHDAAPATRGWARRARPRRRRRASARSTAATDAARRRVVRRIRREGDVRVELPREGLAEGRLEAAGRERPVRQAVVRALERDDPGAARREHRGLERRRHGVGSARAEHHAARTGPRVERGEALAQGELGVGGVHVAEREPEPALPAPRARPTTAAGACPSSSAPNPAARST